MKIINFKKAQGLPLNTIVIALLVVVVLVVLILAFTTNIGGFQRDVERAGAGSCVPSNPVISSIYGSGAEVRGEFSADNGCPAGFNRVQGVEGSSEGNICCARRAQTGENTPEEVVDRTQTGGLPLGE